MNNASPLVETITLNVDSPRANLTGVDFAISRLEALERTQARVQRRYRAIFESSTQVNAPGKGAIAQQSRPSASRQGSSKAAVSVDGKIRLGILGSDVLASLSGKVSLLVNARDIQARVVGSIDADGGRRPTGGGTGGNGRGGGKNPSSVDPRGGGGYDDQRIVRDPQGNILKQADRKFSGPHSERTRQEISTPGEDGTLEVSKVITTDNPRQAQIRATREQAIKDRKAAQKDEEDRKRNMNLERVNSRDQLSKDLSAAGIDPVKQRQARSAFHNREANIASKFSTQANDAALLLQAHGHDVQSVSAANSAASAQKQQSDKAAADAERLRKQQLRAAEKIKRDAKTAARDARTTLREGIANDIAFRRTTLAQSMESSITGLDPRLTPHQRRAEMHKLQSDFHRQMGGAQKSQSSAALAGGDRRTASQLGLASAESFKNAAIETQRATAAQNAFNESSRLIGKNLLQNVAHVSAWAASVGVLYGTLNLAKSSFRSMIEIGFQSARLSQVFRGNASEASRLTDTIMGLASANGRAANDAMQAGVQWSRLGLNRIQVTEAVRVSLMAANVAEITTSQATDHLSSMMKVYGLNVSQLGGVLGELNAISNTYNVSNSDLLEGISRVGSVAKQAQIPLAELMGLIGAGVGATGQTGSQIGNALKSLTGSLETPGVQNKLRQQHGFEVTTDGGDKVRDMSTTLGQLWAAYEKLNASERKSMVFGMVGKNQASRVTALLDNYVRSQVLAISAQLNLNSAEVENSKIVGTLQSQLAALSSEWSRFVNLQGNSGPSQALAATTKAVTNLLRLANTSGGSAAVGIAGTLFTAMAAKIAIVGFQLESAAGKGGIFSNSIKAVKSSMLNLMGIMSHVGTRSRDGLLGFATNGGLNKVHQFGQSLMDRSGYKTNMYTPIGGKGSLPIVEITKATANASKGMYALGVATRFAAVGGGMLVDSLLPLLAIAAAVYTINKAAEHFGTMGGGTEGKLDKFERNKQAAESAAEASAMQARLFENAKTVISAPGPKDHKTESLQQVAAAAFPLVQGESQKETETREAKIKALQAEFALLMKNNDAAGAGLILERLKVEAIERQSKRRQEAFTAVQRSDEVIKARIADIQNGYLGQGGLTKKSKQKSVEELQAKLSENADAKTKLAHDDMETQADALEKQLAADEKHQAYLGRQHNIVSSLSELYQQMGLVDRTSQLDGEIERLKVVEDFHKQALDDVTAEIKAREAAGENTKPEQELLSAAKDKRQSAEKVTQSAGDGFVKMFGSLGSEYKDDTGHISRSKIEGDENYAKASPKSPLGQAKIKFAEADKLSAEASELEKKAAAEHNTGGVGARLQGKFWQETDDLKKSRAELDARANVKRDKNGNRVSVDGPNEAQDRLATVYDHRSVEHRQAVAIGDSHAVGDGAGQQFVAKRAFLQDQINKGLGTQTQQLLYHQQLQEMDVAGQEKLLELHREELNTMKEKTREYQRSLLTAGPGELLRKLAVNQMASKNGGKLTGGQFFAMGSEARGDYMSLPQNSEEMRRIHRDQNALHGAGFREDSSADWTAGLRENHREPIKKIIQNLGPGALPKQDPIFALNESAVKAASAVTSFAAATAAATTSLAGMIAVLDTMRPAAGNAQAINPQFTKPA
jgi:TP901 family phage tail tape measure protein